MDAASQEKGPVRDAPCDCEYHAITKNSPTLGNPKPLYQAGIPGAPLSEDDTMAGSVDENDIVWWDGDKDPENPYHWPSWRKYSNCILISLLTFVEPLASSIFAPGIPKLMEDFQSTNTELAAFVVSVYILGFAFGPMVLAPLSEMVGRLPVYHACNVLFLAFTIACAVAPSLDSLIVLRFLAGTFGAAPMTNGGGSIADMFPAEKRAGVMAAFSIGPLIGPIIGPVIGGFLTDAKGWRWDFWVIAIVSGTISLAMVFVMRESYAPVILARKADRLRKETGNNRLRSKLDSGISNKELFKRCIVRPTRLLIFSPISTVFAVYLAVVYGYLYLLFTSVSYVFQDSYGFTTTTIGLVYLGLGIGSFIGMSWFAWDSGREVQKHINDMKPEVRLKLLPVAAVIFPIGFFVYGWTAHYETHWIAPILGLAIIGISNLLCFMCICVYLVDAYEQYAASALAANTIIRSIAGAFLPLCGLKMYDALGLGWGNSLLGFIAVLLIPVPFVVIRYGERLRKNYEIPNL
ncbi:hypothetical protein AK830_g3786 [Neonectria ditissima]|uniref:Major facilitator superfamily (MFS) profile domain-containing protein n=1 Tax=Neonectria ditissima TaxID=78410 RepID=A0A0P7BAW0_9HYPO|nr:hypothetical protein AK830_g3786 [Neonectria ditissima]